MGEFINFKMQNTITNLTDGLKNKINNNPYYLWIDKKPTVCTYYNQDKLASTLDDSLKSAYEMIGDESPIMYNKISECLLYGIDKMAVSIGSGDFGSEAEDITGDLVVLPNTFQPYEGDYFTINTLGSKYLFKITDVTYDTINNASTYYKASYILTSVESIIKDNQILKRFKMITSLIGTQYNVLLEEQAVDNLYNIEKIISVLKGYYIELFYRTSIQTFAFNWEGSSFYDPYMIEFLIRNDIYYGSNKVFVSHAACKMNPRFNIDYDRTIFKAIEDKNIDSFKLKYAFGQYIDDMMSLLVTRPEDYFLVTYTKKVDVLTIPILTENFSDGGCEYENTSSSAINIIRDYFNNKPIDMVKIEDAINSIEDLYEKELYYYIPFILHILKVHSLQMLE